MGYIAQLRFIDLQAAIEFYVEKLGCELAFTYEGFYAGIIVDDQLLHFKKVSQPEPNIDWVRGNEHLHIMFPVADLELRRQELLERGVVVSAIRDQPWGMECTVTDPEGHSLYFSQIS